MKNVRHKPVEREIKYLEFKSFHPNRPELNVAHSRPMSKSTVVSQSRKNTSSTAKLSVAPARPTSAKPVQTFLTVGSSVNLVATKPNGSQQLPKNVVSSTVHNKLKSELEKSKEQSYLLEKNNEELKMTNSNVISINESLEGKISKLERENEELTDRIELNSDQLNYLNETNEKQLSQLQELQEMIMVLMAEKEATQNKTQELESMNKDLRDLIGELKQASEEKDRAVDVLSGYKTKWEGYRTRLHAAITEKEELINKILANEKFVSVLESDIHDLQEHNRDLKEKNEQLAKTLIEKKRNEDMLRHKYAELKKLNKSFREKETRYMLHDGMPANMAKYTLNSQIPLTIGEKGRTSPSRTYNTTYNAYASIDRNPRAPAKASNQHFYNLLGQTRNAEHSTTVRRNE